MTTTEWIAVGMVFIMAIAVGGTALIVAFRARKS
jgi:hypothetical protein